jgi:hypothetical protein
MRFLKFAVHPFTGAMAREPQSAKLGDERVKPRPEPLATITPTASPRIVILSEFLFAVAENTEGTPARSR